MTQAIDENRAQRSANLQEQAEELARLHRIATALTPAYNLHPPCKELPMLHEK
jgi:hypothetical protein